jgi:ribosomal protein S18 acetylase RimI-like enzyme
MLNRKKFTLISNNQLASSGINATYAFLQGLNAEYPNFRDWYYEKVVKDISSSKRKIVVVNYFGRIIATAILKNEASEKKICTLRVHPAFQRHGLGSLLLRKSFAELETLTPLITVSSTKVIQFSPLLTRYGFQLTEVNKDYYGRGLDEYVYNGTLKRI